MEISSDNRGPSPADFRRAEDSQLWTPLRLELAEFFDREAASLSPAYRGAVCILGDTEFPGRVRFICHAVRDIGDRLAFVLDRELKPNRVQYEDHLDKIKDRWPYDALGSQIVDLTSQERSTTDDIPIPKWVYGELDILMRSHKERRESPDRFELLFRALLKAEAANNTITAHQVKLFKGEHGWFKALAHFTSDPPQPLPDGEVTCSF